MTSFLHCTLTLRESLECQVARLVYGEPVRRHFDVFLPLARAHLNSG